MNEKIRIKNSEVLNSKEKFIVEKLLKRHYPKVERLIKNLDKFEVKIKKYHNEGRRAQYSINLKAIPKHRKFEADHADWNLSKGMKKALKKLINEIEDKHHISDTHHVVRKKKSKSKKLFRLLPFNQWHE